MNGTMTWVGLDVHALHARRGDRLAEAGKGLHQSWD